MLDQVARTSREYLVPPFERIESLRSVLRFRVLLGSYGAGGLEVVRA
jgi:hypothetical protein